MREVEVLVDWQNVLAGWRASTGSRGVSDIDAEDVVAHLVGHVRQAMTPLSDEAGIQATVWIYGSGITPTDRFGMRIRTALNKSRLSERKLRLTLNPIDRSVHSAGEPLQVSICPYDAERECRKQGCSAMVREQKLADTMIVADAAYLGMYASIGLVVISDDVDMVPGLLLAAQLRRNAGGNPPKELVWYRPGRSAANQQQKYAKHFMTKGATN